MATKKKTTAKNPNYYIVMDSDMDIVCQGEWDEVKEQLEEMMWDNTDSENNEMISDFTIHELTAGKKLKFIPQVPASVEL